MKQKLTIGFSPCPNDTFMFDALVNGKIDTGNLEFEVYMEDVETLNQWAAEGRLDITKVSYNAFLSMTDKYALLDSGSALGNGCGPLLISAQPMDKADVPHKQIAIPGVNTTANLLFSLAFPEARNKQAVRFSDIEKLLLDGEMDCGVIIHENRFTYAQKGLYKIQDLGEYWENLTGCPIPLGGIIIKRTIAHGIQQQVNQLLGQSVQYAFAHYPQLGSFVTDNAQEMDEDVMRQHINLYVNDYSVSLGEKGRAAISRLFTEAHQRHIIDHIPENIYA